MDVKKILLHGDLQEVHMELPRGISFKDQNNKVLSVEKGHVWAQKTPGHGSIDSVKPCKIQVTRSVMQITHCL